MNDRIGTWGTAYSGRKYWPGDIRPEDIDIDDIAHALSHICRFGGHCLRFYSVAEHSVLVSQVVPREHALQALLHDATEAYLVDVPRPLKALLPEYSRLEQRAWEVIADKFGVPVEFYDSVKEADNTVLLAEKKVLVRSGETWSLESEYKPADVIVWGFEPTNAKSIFLARYWDLIGRSA